LYNNGVQKETTKIQKQNYLISALLLYATAVSA